MNSIRRKFRLLLTGAGAPGTSGTIFSLRHGAASDSVEIELLGADMRQDNVVLSEFKSFHELPSPETSDYIPTLKSIVDTFEIDLVVPQTTKENLVLSAAQEEIKVLTSPASAIRVANDKLLLTELFSILNLGAPNYRRADSMDSLVAAAEELEYPEKDIVVKLTNGNGGRGVRRVSSRVETYREFSENKPDGMRTTLENLLQTLANAEHFPTLLVSEALSAPEITVDVYSGKSGYVSVPRFRNEVRSGITMRSTIFQDHDISRKLEIAVDALGLSGAFGFQFMKRESDFCVIECNPRVQGTMVASIMSGNNIIWLASRDALGISSVAKLSRSWSSGEFQRTWGGELRWKNQKVRI